MSALWLSLSPVYVITAAHSPTFRRESASSTDAGCRRLRAAALLLGAHLDGDACAGREHGLEAGRERPHPIPRRGPEVDAVAPREEEAEDRERTCFVCFRRQLLLPAV